MDNLALSNALTTPSAAIVAAGSQASATPADTAGETPFGDVLARQLALADAQKANSKDAKSLLLEATEAQLQASAEVQPIDIIQQIVIDPALLAQQASAAVATDQALPSESLVDALKKTNKSTDADVASDQSAAQQDVTPVLAGLQAAGNLQPAVVASDISSGKDLPVSGVGASAADTLTALTASSQSHASAEQADIESAEASASFAARLESALAADGSKPKQNDLAIGNHVSAGAAEKTANAAPTSAGIPQQVGTPHWETGLGDKVVWMIGSQTQSAQLHLNPPNLGPLEIKLSMADGQASLSFVTQHAAVRDAIEAASPKLRDMMGESGISMGSVSVNVGSFSQQQQASQQQNSSGGSSGNSPLSDGHQAADITEPISVAVQNLEDQGLVDLFA
jgi:flagellar hook-length control protein FliK